MREHVRIYQQQTAAATAPRNGSSAARTVVVLVVVLAPDCASIIAGGGGEKGPLNGFTFRTRNTASSAAPGSPGLRERGSNYQATEEREGGREGATTKQLDIQEHGARRRKETRPRKEKEETNALDW